MSNAEEYAAIQSAMAKIIERYRSHPSGDSMALLDPEFFKLWRKSEDLKNLNGGNVPTDHESKPPTPTAIQPGK